MTMTVQQTKKIQYKKLSNFIRSHVNVINVFFLQLFSSFLLIRTKKMDLYDFSSFVLILEENDFSVPLIIALSTGLASLFIVLVLLAVYLTFSNNSIFLGSNFNVPGEFDDEESRLHEESNELPKLTEQERSNYFQAKNFQLEFPPVIKPLGETLSEVESQYINERGIQAYGFEIPDEWYGSRDVSIFIEDKLDISFNSNLPSSTILNYPLPISSTNDTTYFEVKLFSKPKDTVICIGVSSKPYPLFALPGYHKYSLAYDSTGKIRINEPFDTPAIFNKLEQGDVLGVGFKQRSGTLFFTHNGKRVHDAIHNLKFDLYPHVGAVGNCQVSVNLGQLGFVFIEANVKKWGFGTVTGAIGIPPPYGKEVGEILDKGEELPPTYPSEEDTFFGPSALLSLPIIPKVNKNRPPSYKDEPKLQATDEEIDEPLNEGLYERMSSSYDLQNNIENNSLIINEPRNNKKKAKKKKNKRKK